MVFIIWNLSVADKNHGDRFLDFVTVKKGLEDGSLLLIDVRNPKERAESGCITLAIKALDRLLGWI